MPLLQTHNLGCQALQIQVVEAVVEPITEHQVVPVLLSSRFQIISGQKKNILILS